MPRYGTSNYGQTVYGLNLPTRNLQLRSYHGSPTPDGGVDISVSPIRFKVPNNINQFLDSDYAQADNVDGAKLPEPGGMAQYSYIKNLRFFCSHTPINFLGNIRLYLESWPASWIGVQVYIQRSSGYVDPIAHGSTPLAGFVGNISDYTNANPMFFPDTVTTGGQTGGLGDWMQLQARFTYACRPGKTSKLPLTFTWDEWDPI